jgi:hypothetical protein
MMRCFVRVGSSALAISLCACSPASLTEEEHALVLRWLSCDDCGTEVRDSVASLGARAVQLLEQPLDTTSDGARNLRRAMEDELLEAYSMLGPQRPDSIEYMQFFVGNFFAAAQKRAAASLGDLAARNVSGARTALQQARSQAVGRGLRADVVTALESALAHADSGGSPPVARVVVVPDSFHLAEGRSARPAAMVLDSSGTALRNPSIRWESSDPTYAQVDATTGEVTAVAVGPVEVWAIHTPTADTGRAVVIVDSASPAFALRFGGGDRQTGQAGLPLDGAVVLRAIRPDGSAAGGVPIVWSVGSGGGLALPAQGLTDASGSASATWRLGDSLGVQTLRAGTPSGLFITFRATAVPYTGPSMVAGTVTAGGVGVAGVTVTLTGAANVSTTTGASGRFSFTSLPVGSYSITISGFPPGTVFPSTSQAFDLSAPTGQIVNIDFASL